MWTFQFYDPNESEVSHLPSLCLCLQIFMLQVFWKSPYYMFPDKFQVTQSISDIIKYYLEHKKVVAKEVKVFCEKPVDNKPITVHCTNIKGIPGFC